MHTYGNTKHALKYWGWGRGAGKQHCPFVWLWSEQWVSLLEETNSSWLSMVPLVMVFHQFWYFLTQSHHKLLCFYSFCLLVWKSCTYFAIILNISTKYGHTQAQLQILSLQASRFQLTLLYVMLNEVCIVEVFWSYILLSSFLNHLIFFGWSSKLIF
jgi:hypothetical protein